MPNLEVGWYARVAALVSRVPAGAVTTYGDVASALGAPRAARQVGWALAALPEGTEVPWQRVINVKGTISFKGDTARGILQRALLEGESIVFDEHGRVQLASLRYRFTLDDFVP